MKSLPSRILLASLLPLSTCRAFIIPSSLASQQRCSSSPNTALAAKKNKKKRNSSSGEGFGKSSATSPSIGKAVRDDTPAGSATADPRALQSINAPSTVTTQQEQQQSSPSGGGTTEQLNLDPNLSPEEKSQAILRSKFGLKSYEEQQADIGDYRALKDSEAKKKKRDKLRNLDKLWPEDKPDLLSVLPPALIKGVDTFLKVGLGICTLAFLVAGVLITIEAGAKATGGELPAGLEAFVLDVVQPDFTPGLGVLLAFSVSLGLFSIGLGGTAASSYREDP